jgi:hypothetical protein
MASISMEIYEVLFQDIIRGTLIEAGISGPEAAGLVASQNTEYLFLLCEFGGVGVRKYENRWTIFVSGCTACVYFERPKDSSHNYRLHGKTIDSESSEIRATHLRPGLFER